MKDAGIKRSERYRDIRWLMEIIDVELCLSRLNIKITKPIGTNWEGYCPDHCLFKGCEPSDPRWYINVKTGKTHCKTEGRGSNFLYITARLLKKNNKQLRMDDCEKAIKFLTGRNCSDVEIDFLRNKNLMTRLNQKEKDIINKPRTWLSDIKDGIKGGYISSRTVKYFLTPPNKPATNIIIETLKHYDVFEKTNGYYANRAIIPIKQNGDILGFIAVDILGKEKWLMSHPTNNEKDYRKTLYPSSENGFRKKYVLFGTDDCDKGADYLIITEGAREVMKLWQEGFKNSVAILGSSLSDEQLMLITKLAPKKLILMFDGDTAGRQIAKNVKEKVKELFQTITINLSEGVDPKQLNRLQISELISIK